MKTRSLLLTGWLLFCLMFAFSQDAMSKKHDFIYKSINGHDIMATIYLPDSDKKVPVFIYYHGGGFIFGNRHQGLHSELIDKLLANKIAVVSADYRLAPETKLKEILKDVSDMVKWIKIKGEGRFNIDTGKIAVGGASAGGYLAFTTGFNPQHSPDAIVAISAPTGFSTAGIKAGDLSLLKNIKKDSIVSYGDYTTRMDLWRYLGKNGLALYELFGFDPVKEPYKLKPYTLIDNVKTGYPPTLIVHAKKDWLVKLEDVDAFYKFLQNKKIESELYLVENGHDSNLIDRHPEAIDKIITFLNKQFNKKKK